LGSSRDVTAALCYKPQDDVSAGLYSFDMHEDGNETNIWRRADTRDEAEVAIPFFFIVLQSRRNCDLAREE